MKWLKYRSHYAWGCNDWAYKPLYADKITKELKEEIKGDMEHEAEENSWTDKFRRIEYEIIDHTKVPNSKIEEKYNNMQYHVRDMRESIKESTKNLVVIKELFGKGRKTDPDEVEYAKHRAKMNASIKKIETARRKAEIDTLEKK